MVMATATLWVMGGFTVRLNPCQGDGQEIVYTNSVPLAAVAQFHSSDDHRQSKGSRKGTALSLPTQAAM